MLSKISQGLPKHIKAAQATIQAIKSFGNKNSTDDSGMKASEFQDYGVTPRDQHLQFSKAPIMSNFGELPFGEIPEPLKYVRPFEITTLSNGIRVCTEQTASPLATVGVYVNAGSRNECLETSGTAHLLGKMFNRGTQSRSKTQIQSELETMGAFYKMETGREVSKYKIKMLKSDVSKGVKLLGDMICNSQLTNTSEFELLKEEQSNEHEENHHRYQETLIENVHFNVYREHMIGQPKFGDRDNVHALKVDHLKNFHSTYFFGDNMTVVGVGNINHQEFVNQVNQHFSSLSKKTAGQIKGIDRPIYIPALLFIRDDEMYNSNVGVFYDAPSVKHKDYYAFLLLKHMFGSYRIDKNAEHLNDVKKQYNSMHALLGDLPDVTIGESKFYSYSDCGIFGNYFFGNEVFTRQMNYCGVCLPTIYSHFLNDVEIYRGRNNLYNMLLNKEQTDSIADEIGKQIIQIGRRIPRSEIAKRVAHLDNNQMKHLCNDWFYDAEPSFTNWGPIEHVSQVGSYKYFKVNTMSTITNAHHTLFT